MFGSLEEKVTGADDVLTCPAQVPVVLSLDRRRRCPDDAGFLYSPDIGWDLLRSLSSGTDRSSSGSYLPTDSRLFLTLLTFDHPISC
jgi:hypothetical protein